MHIEDFREYCLKMNGVTESFPFNESTLVFKVMNKMFALTNLDGVFSINLKCDPEDAIRLREEFPAVRPGYHMSKKHWNTILIDGSIEDQKIYQWIDVSYALVVASLSQKLRMQLNTTK